MRASESLNIIRPFWLKRATNRMARAEGVREDFGQQLEHFFDLLTQAVETGDSAWIEGLLQEWVEALTESELETRESALLPLISQAASLTLEVAREVLEDADSLALLEAVLPVYSHAYEFVARQVTQIQVSHISHKLTRVQSDLERLDKTKSDFIAIAAHELKTPLTLIEGYITMLSEGLPQEDGLSQAQLLIDGVHSGTHRLQEIINDMIDVSMIDSDLLSLTFQPVWIHRMLEMIQNEFRETAEQRRLTLQVHPFPGWDQVTTGDPERLYQAFRNVVMNAIKFTPDGGKIVLDGRVLPGFIEVRVADTGIGIDPEDQARIFEKFGRVGNVSLHSSGKTKFKGGGPGLGLPISKGIIEAHGGAIWVDSDGYDEARLPGTTVHILLPVRSEPPEEQIGKLFKSDLKSESWIERFARSE